MDGAGRLPYQNTTWRSQLLEDNREQPRQDRKGQGYRLCALRTARVESFLDLGNRSREGSGHLDYQGDVEG